MRGPVLAVASEQGRGNQLWQSTMEINYGNQLWRLLIADVKLISILTSGINYVWAIPLVALIA